LVVVGTNLLHSYWLKVYSGASSAVIVRTATGLDVEPTDEQLENRTQFSFNCSLQLESFFCACLAYICYRLAMHLNDKLVSHMTTQSNQKSVIWKKSVNNYAISFVVFF